MSVRRAFARSLASLADIVAFAADFIEHEGLDPALRPRVDFAIEEVFTNMIKYGGRSPAVEIELAREGDGLVATLIDLDAERFDLTAAPGADTRLPLEQRRPGGLGVHLLRRVADEIEYAYAASERRARVTLRLKPVAAATSEEGHARD